MNITNIEINVKEEREAEDNKLKAFVNVTFDDCFVVRNMRVIKTDDRTFVAMPCYKAKNGNHYDIAHPINKDFRDQLEAAVLVKYAELTATGV